ncbi:MAG TPA: phosphotransferase family protein [Solirubrobacterales bacterium]
MSAPSPEIVRSLIAEVDADPGEISLSVIPGGASRQTWLITEGDRGAGKRDQPRWVIRRDPEGSVSLVPIADEFALIARAREAGVPVPEPLALEPAGGRLGTAAMLMTFVAGTSVAPRILRKPEYVRARESLPAQLAAALAAIHSLTAVDVAGSLPPAGANPALDQISEWERQLDEIGEPLPAIELGLRWLRVNAPEPAEPRLVHGDFRLGNFIVDERGLAAVIDWELAHLGDPAEDIGWLCIRSWRFGNDDLPVAGVGQLDDFIAAYEAAGGSPVDRDRVRYWEAFGNVKWAVICARQAHDHLSGVRRSHELASLGRRICEPEWDLLELMRHHQTGCSSASPAEHPRI